jgi:hypothetical protein
VTTRLPNASQQAGADAVVDRVDVGSAAANGVLRIYSGAQPADADSAPNGTLLLEIDLDNPAFGAANASGVATASGFPKTAAGEAGAGAGTDAQSCRVVNRDGATVFDGSVTETGGGGNIELDNTNIASAQNVTLSSLTYTHPAE